MAEGQDDPTNVTMRDLLHAIQSVERVLGDRIDALAVSTDRRFDAVDQRFDLVDQRFAEIDQRFVGVDQRFEGIDQRLNGIDQRLNGIDQRLNGIDQRLGGIDQCLGGIDQRLDDLTGEVRLNQQQVAVAMRKLTQHDERIRRIETELPKPPRGPRRRRRPPSR